MKILSGWYTKFVGSERTPLWRIEVSHEVHDAKDRLVGGRADIRQRSSLADGSVCWELEIIGTRNGSGFGKVRPPETFDELGEAQAEAVKRLERQCDGAKKTYARFNARATKAVR